MHTKSGLQVTYNMFHLFVHKRISTRYPEPIEKANIKSMKSKSFFILNAILSALIFVSLKACPTFMNARALPFPIP